ncbi:hypothetical protein C2E23DRAFT_867870 [Lenzites betulinus]|nr:hypothetical protein C2E23DRAFT_867870 [Lenzites betulinus]
MCITCSVISGSAALHILDIDRTVDWTPSDLDVYTPLYSAAQVISYLCIVEKYEPYGDAINPPYPGVTSGFRSVVRLRRGEQSIDIIQSLTRSALHPIPYFWSTHVMNYVTADSFCVAYPDLTLAGRALLNPIQLLELEHPSSNIVDKMLKYIDRGYDFRKHPTAWEMESDAATECNDGPACFASWDHSVPTTIPPPTTAL